MILLLKRENMEIKQKYLKEFLIQTEFPLDAQKELCALFDRFILKKEPTIRFFESIERYKTDELCYKEEASKILELAEETEEKPYALILLFVIFLTKELKAKYDERGYEESVFLANVMDVRYKAVECKEVEGYWGIFCVFWFHKMFALTRFAFEKLQFQIAKFENEYHKNGLNVGKDDLILDVHIPRTGGKLTRESKDASYRQAAEFFKKHFNLPPIFVCWSWLLFPKNKEVLSPSSNLYAFISDFDIFQVTEYSDYEEVWRLFDKKYNGNPDELPQDTSLRRAYVEWIKQGIKTGWGGGIFELQNE